MYLAPLTSRNAGLISVSKLFINVSIEFSNGEFWSRASRIITVRITKNGKSILDFTCHKKPSSLGYECGAMRMTYITV